MKKIYMLCIFIVLLMLKLNCLFAFDTEQISEDVRLNKLIKELNEYSEGLDLGTVSQDLLSGKALEYENILDKIINIIKSSLIPCMKEILLILAFIVIISATKALELDKDSTITKIANMITVLIIITYLLTTFSEFITTVKKVISVESSIIQIASPFLMSLLILTGAATTVGILYNHSTSYNFDSI